MKIGIILGTRPEIIKMSSIISECERKKIDFFILHTNQHYAKNLDKIFFEDLQLPKPKYNLNIGSGNYSFQIGKMLIGIENVLIKETPDIVLVQGDTNTVLAGALVASGLNIKVGHVEAGLRSYDKNMPEERNRVIVDHLSDFLFCPTIKQKAILLKEGIDKNKIFVTGNTIVDIVLNIQKNINMSLLKKYGLEKKEYILVTMHRPSNVDDKIILEKQLKNISDLAKNRKIKVIFPVHPRTLKNIKKFNIKIPNNIMTINPLGIVDLITLEKFAKIILTDSGGIQEEACILGTPCLILRENTERPECLEVGAGKIVGSDIVKFEEGFLFYDDKNIKWKNPFGDGKTFKKIITSIKNEKG